MPVTLLTPPAAGSHEKTPVSACLCHLGSDDVVELIQRSRPPERFHGSLSFRTGSTESSARDSPEAPDAR